MSVELKDKSGKSVFQLIEDKQNIFMQKEEKNIKNLDKKN